METAAGIYMGIITPDPISKAGWHLSTMQKAMLDVTPDCIQILSVEGTLLTMNRAGCVALNIPEDCGFGIAWLGLLPEGVRPWGIEALRKAASGQSARFAGTSVSEGGPLYWDNLLTPVIDMSGAVAAILCISRDTTRQTLLEMQLEDAVNREKLLSREMQHRVKNLLSVVSGLISIAEQEAATADAPLTATTILREKLDALSRASDAAFVHDDGKDEDGSSTDLSTLVRSVLKPYGANCQASGCAFSIRGNAIMTLALFLHELATNSVKYGALQREGGAVTVRWLAKGDMLELMWVETGGPPVRGTPVRCGFGSEMVDKLMRSAGGAIDRTWQADGLVVAIRLPSSFCS